MERDEHSGGSSPRFGLPFPEQILSFSCLPSCLGIVRAAPEVHSLMFWNDDLRHTVGFLVVCRSQRSWGYSLIFLSIRRTEEALGSKSRQPSSQEKLSTKYGRGSVRHRKGAQLLSYHKDVATQTMDASQTSHVIDLHRFIEDGKNAPVHSASEPVASTLVCRFSMSESLHIMLQIAEGILFLHENGVAHGDLKPKNILVSPRERGISGSLDQNVAFQLTVADFGLVQTKLKSKSLVSQQALKLETVRWRAPELLDKNLLREEEQGSFTDSDWDSDSSDGNNGGCIHKFTYGKLSRADVYSFAVTCSQILTGEDPYSGLGLNDLVRKISGPNGLRPGLPCGCPTQLRNLINRCWGEELKRPTFIHILRELKDLQASHTAGASDAPEMAFLKPKFKSGASGNSGNALIDEAEHERNQELGRLYTSTRAGKHFQKEIVKGVENFISIGNKQCEIASKLADDCKKYGSEGPGVKDKLAKATVQYGSAKQKMEKERDNLHRALSTLVADPLKAMASGSPLKDARQLKQKYDRLRQDADTQATEVGKRKSKESNAEHAGKLQAAEQKLEEITAAMDTMGKNALSAMSLVESQQQTVSLQKILAMVEYERAYFQRVTSILDQLHHDIDAQVTQSTTLKLTQPLRPLAIKAYEEEDHDRYEEKGARNEQQEVQVPVAESRVNYATATHDFEGEDVGELTIAVGDKVLVRQVTASGWSEGMCNGHSGWFPSDYVEKQPPQPAPARKSSAKSGSSHGSHR